MVSRVRVLARTAVGLGATGFGYYYYQTQKKASSISTNTAMSDEPSVKDTRPFQLLTPEAIDARLRSEQSAIRSKQRHVKAIYCNRLPSNSPVEDHYSVYALGDNALIAGVFDGHIGPACSRLIERQLPIYVARQLATQKPQEPAAVEEAIATAFVDLDDDIQQRFYDLFPRNIIKATESDIRNAVLRHPNPQAAAAIVEEAITGSCACMVYIDGDDVYAANAGDSRVTIIRQEEDGTWNGRRLVEEQSPGIPFWREHMVSQHPPNESETTIMRKRIFGLLAVGGAFGDIMYKVPRDYQTRVLPFIPPEIYARFSRYHHRIIANYHTPPYLYSKPLVKHHKLQRGDRYIVIGSDGLWDELSWRDVHSELGDQAAAELMSTRGTKKEKNPATHLLRESLSHQVLIKNVGRDMPMTDETLELSKRLTRQPSRRYRDDITITVIELKGEDEPHESQFDHVGAVIDMPDVPVGDKRLVDPRHKSSWTGWIRSFL